MLLLIGDLFGFIVFCLIVWLYWPALKPDTNK